MLGLLRLHKAAALFVMKWSFISNSILHRELCTTASVQVFLFVYVSVMLQPEASQSEKCDKHIKKKLQYNHLKSPYQYRVI